MISSVLAVVIEFHIIGMWLISLYRQRYSNNLVLKVVSSVRGGTSLEFYGENEM